MEYYLDNKIEAAFYKNGFLIKGRDVCGKKPEGCLITIGNGQDTILISAETTNHGSIHYFIRHVLPYLLLNEENSIKKIILTGFFSQEYYVKEFDFIFSDNDSFYYLQLPFYKKDFQEILNNDANINFNIFNRFSKKIKFRGEVEHIIYRDNYNSENRNFIEKLLNKPQWYE